MSEAAEAVDPVDNANEAPSVDVEAIQAENAAMKAKLDELLGETKRAKAAAREADERARREAEEKARKAGDFEQLHKSSEQARQQLEEELNNLRSSIANEKRSNAAMKIAAELAEGANAEILSEFVGRRIKYTDDGLKVLNEAGELTVSSIDELVQEFRGNQRFASLLKGNQSSGGGATGGTKQGASAKEMSRNDFDQLSPAKQMEFIKGGGRTFD